MTTFCTTTENTSPQFCADTANIFRILSAYFYEINETSGICTETSGICTRTSGICTETSGICTETSGICTETSGICTETFATDYSQLFI
jgi:hypothetical protein